MSETNKAVVLEFIAAMGTSDPARAAPCLNADAYTEVRNWSKFAGRRETDVIVGTIGAFDILLPTGLCPEIVSMTAEEDRVVVEFEGRATASDGTPYANNYCMVFTMRGGKIARVHEYFCSKLADDVLWPLVEKMGGAAAGEGETQA